MFTWIVPFGHLKRFTIGDNSFEFYALIYGNSAKTTIPTSYMGYNGVAFHRRNYSAMRPDIILRRYSK